MAARKLTSDEPVSRESPTSGTHRVAVRRVLTRPDVRLSLSAEDVDPIHPDTVALADTLVATMRSFPGCVGIAAPQIGERSRLFCVDVTGHRHARSCAGLVVLCNPTILWKSYDVVLREGCLSVPHLTGNVARAAHVIVKGVEPGTGRLLRIHADGMEARCLQHEIDHLDGFLFVDRVRDPATDLFARKTYE